VLSLYNETACFSSKFFSAPRGNSQPWVVRSGMEEYNPLSTRPGAPQTLIGTHRAKLKKRKTLKHSAWSNTFFGDPSISQDRPSGPKPHNKVVSFALPRARTRPDTQRAKRSINSSNYVGKELSSCSEKAAKSEGTEVGKKCRAKSKIRVSSALRYSDTDTLPQWPAASGQHSDRP
jgi:hypothetical protein